MSVSVEYPVPILGDLIENAKQLHQSCVTAMLSEQKTRLHKLQQHHYNQLPESIPTLPSHHSPLLHHERTHRIDYASLQRLFTVLCVYTVLCSVLKIHKHLVERCLWQILSCYTTCLTLEIPTQCIVRVLEKIMTSIIMGLTNEYWTSRKVKLTIEQTANSKILDHQSRYACRVLRSKSSTPKNNARPRLLRMLRALS